MVGAGLRPALRGYAPRKCTRLFVPEKHRDIRPVLLPGHWFVSSQKRKQTNRRWGGIFNGDVLHILIILVCVGFWVVFVFKQIKRIA